MNQMLIKPKFVRHIPQEIKEGILYISIPYSTAIHKCPCGCGESVVTPITPTDWHLTWDGKTITLRPSLGNWSLPCRSHYWIVKNEIVWARKWTDYEVCANRARESLNKERYYDKLTRSGKRKTKA